MRRNAKQQVFESRGGHCCEGSQLESNGTKQILRLLGLCFFDMLSYAMLGPILTLLFIDGPHSLFASSESQHFLFGIYLSLFSFVQIFSLPLWGRLSLRIKKKQVLKINFAGNALAYFIGFVGVYLANIPLLFFGVVVAGLSCANIPTINSLIAEYTPKAKWTQYFSLLGASVGLAFVIGPQISALFMRSLPAKMVGTLGFAICAITSFLICVYIHFFIENRPRSERPPPRSCANINISWLCNSGKGLQKILCFQFLVSLAWYFFIKFFQVYLIEAKSFGEVESCYGVSFLGLCCCFWQGIRYLKELNIKGEQYNFVVLVALMGLSILGFLIVDKYFVIMGLIVLLSFSYSMIMPASISLLLGKGDDYQEMKTAWFQWVQCLAKVLAPIASGYLFAKTRDASAYLASLALLMAFFLILFNPSTFKRKLYEIKDN